MSNTNVAPDLFTDNMLRDGMWIRLFDPCKPHEDYVWHRDYTCRAVTILSGDGWRFQFDNELPFFINKGDELTIPKMIYHRIIPGTTPLRIKIDEMVEQATKLAIA